jgi:hypothetical protein
MVTGTLGISLFESLRSASLIPVDLLDDAGFVPAGAFFVTVTAMAGEVFDVAFSAPSADGLASLVAGAFWVTASVLPEPDVQTTLIGGSLGRESMTRTVLPGVSRRYAAG